MNTPQRSVGPPGRLFGVGVGPGDPELVTVKARRIIESVSVIAFPAARDHRSVARSIAAPYLPAGAIEIPLVYPVTIGQTNHPDGYEGALRDFYDQSAAELALHLDAGRDVVVLCEGDPFFYGSYMYLHERLAPHYPTEVVPGVTSFSAAAASAGTPLAKRDDVLTILPGTLPGDVLATRLRGSDAAVVMKLGRTFERVRGATRAAGVQDRAVYVERASSTTERTAMIEDVRAEEAPYMSLVLIPTAHRTGMTAATPTHRTGSVSVVGLGPAGAQWLTPEAQAELAEADVLIGYLPYLDRVPTRPGQRRLGSDNRVEADRAREALALAAAGARVAVVSSGDPGIFAMAAAVFEALEEAQAPLGDVTVRVVPGLSAMQAAASRVGAPLGHDFAVVSLSDNLKPWEVIERRLDAAAGADLVLALYNPASQTRRTQLERAIKVVRRHREGTTPVVVARAVGSDVEAVTVTTLATIDVEAVDMRTLLIIGSSMTRTLSRPGQPGPDRVYTPRGYPEV